MPLGETIVALSTPSGPSALAMIRLSGPHVPELTTQFFQSSCLPEPRKATLGHYITQEGTLVDQAVYIYYPEASSYTGEPLLEICPHGNPIIIQSIIEDAIARGCRLADGGEFTRTAFLNGKMDLTQAEAVCDVITARSEKALKNAQSHLSGSLGKRISEYTDKLLHISAEIEAYIDFPEEDLPPEDPQGPYAKLTQLIHEFKSLADTSQYKALIHEGIRTVIIGAPNAGKSTLLNALVGEERVLVSETPGTTRDYVSERINLGGFTINLVDTAGIRTSDDTIESLGMTKTLEQAEKADLHILVLDTADPHPMLPPEALASLNYKNTIILENKCDLPTFAHPEPFLPSFPRTRVSLKTSDGYHTFLDALTAKCKALTDDGELQDSLVVNARQSAALLKAVQSLHKAQTHLLDQQALELTASEIRNACDALGDVLGKIDNEAMLDKLFATFCIGK